MDTLFMNEVKRIGGNAILERNTHTVYGSYRDTVSIGFANCDEEDVLDVMYWWFDNRNQISRIMLVNNDGVSKYAQYVMDGEGHTTEAIDGSVLELLMSYFNKETKPSPYVYKRKLDVYIKENILTGEEYTITGDEMFKDLVELCCTPSLNNVNGAYWERIKHAIRAQQPMDK